MRIYTRLSFSVIMFCFYVHTTYGQVTYCTPAGTCPANDKVYITSVKFNTLNSPSACGGYKLFAEAGTTTTTVERGTSYEMSVGFYGYYFDAIFKENRYYSQSALAYIDFNGDGDFDDEGEYIRVGSGDDSRPAKAMISIPGDAKLGKMRVRLRQIIAVSGAEAITACNNMANSLFKAYDIEDYTITVIEKNTLPPSCPSVYSPADNAVNVPRNAGLTFTWNGSTGGTNTTYDFYLGTSSTALAAVALNIASTDGTTGKYAHPNFLEPGTTYYYKVVAKNNRGTSACSAQKFTTATTTNDYYCTPKANCDIVFNSYIKSVNFNTISNTTTCSGQSAYILYPTSGTTTTTVTKGSSYTLHIETSQACNLGYLGAWIDYNRNGSFDDPGEFTAIANQDPLISCGIRTVSIAIPAGAGTGTTRMRVRLSFENSVTADESCADYSGGETEDYTVTLAAPSACSSLSATYTKIDNTSASGANGTITVTPVGGTLPYSITWAGEVLSGFNPTALTAGVYYATITDGVGCSYTTPPININAPPVFNLEGIVVIQPSCKENGSIRVDVSGGVGPYTFQWSNGATAGNFVNNLSPAVYSAEIRDSQGQVLQTGSIALHAFAASYTVVPAICGMGSTGEIHVNTIGGIPPYRYQWIQTDPPGPVYFTSPDISAGIGKYQVTITDAADCAIVISGIEVTGPPPIAVDVAITPVNCNGNGSANGEIWLTGSNGTAPYRYDVYVNSELQSFAAVEDAAGFRYVDVPAGQPYTIIAYDVNGCQSKYTNIDAISTIPEPDPAWGFMFACSGKPAEVTYGGYTPGINFVWYADADGTVALDTATVFTTPVLQETVKYYMATYQNGCRSTAVIDYTISVVTTPGKPVIAVSGSTLLCNGSNVSLYAPQGYPVYRWSNGAQTAGITTASAGNYTVQVQDGFGCESPESDPVEVSLGLPSATPVISASGDLTFCDGGQVVLSAQAGYTTYKWSDNGSVREVTVTSSGVYTVRATQNGKCESAASDPVSVVVKPLPAKPVISPSGPLSFCAGGLVILTAQGTAQHRWSTGDFTQQIQVNESGTYTVTATESGCESSAAEAVVTVFGLPSPPTAIAQSSASTLRAIDGGNAYAWTLNGSLLPFSTAEITAAASGHYEVRSISDHGCLSAQSAGYDFVVTALEHTGPDSFSLYPNPSSALLHVVVGEYNRNTTDVRIVNSLGQAVAALKLERNAQEIMIDVSTLPPGQYMLILSRGESTVTKAFVRQ